MGPVESLVAGSVGRVLSDSVANPPSDPRRWRSVLAHCGRQGCADQCRPGTSGVQARVLSAPGHLPLPRNSNHRPGRSRPRKANDSEGTLHGRSDRPRTDAQERPGLRYGRASDLPLPELLLTVTMPLSARPASPTATSHPPETGARTDKET
ncbi:hypothetical protein GCM10009757_11560 [Streptomyces cheonanensis]|uniref:Uncharacterized protein n=1 Tax=Streptomyces cheonanensis TaxID=312720 RepID=A0ABN2UYX6_9ACTN